MDLQDGSFTQRLDVVNIRIGAMVGVRVCETALPDRLNSGQQKSNRWAAVHERFGVMIMSVSCFLINSAHIQFWIITAVYLVQLIQLWEKIKVCFFGGFFVKGFSRL